MQYSYLSCAGSYPFSIVIIGDSTAARAAIALHNLFRDCKLLRDQGRCNYDKYYNIQYDNKRLINRIPKGYGPIEYGLRHRGCQDCSGCGARKWMCNNSTFLVEFIGVEFALDVEYPTKKHGTTQESIIHGYLKDRYEKPCVYVNTGLHDASMKQNSLKKSRSYKKNLQKFLQIVLEVFSQEQVVWLTTTGVRKTKQPRKWRKILSNTIIENFNDISFDLAAKHEIQVLDLYHLSRISPFYELNVDGVHYGSPVQAYYIEVAQNIFMNCMQKQQNIVDLVHSKEIRNIHRFRRNKGIQKLCPLSSTSRNSIKRNSRKKT
jgi:hypothetical protein